MMLDSEKDNSSDCSSNFKKKKSAQLKGTYNFDEEPQAVWMMDKESKDSSKRWKIIVAFKNGDIRELVYKTLGEANEIVLNEYLNDESFKKLPGKIVKIFRCRNAKTQPVYFLTKNNNDTKQVLSTIEFETRTFRQFDIEQHEKCKEDFLFNCKIDFNNVIQRIRVRTRSA